MTKKNNSNEEVDLFRSSIGEVKRIETDIVVLKPAIKPKPYPSKKIVEKINPLKKNVLNEIDTLYQEDTMSYISPGLQKNILKKMRKGRFGIDADIDLHGLSSREAMHHLINFLHHCVEAGYRCVHIVHGKGYHSPANQPILKNDINMWLRQHQDVLAFCSAPAQEGGAGALYVLLQLSDKFGQFDAED